MEILRSDWQVLAGFWDESTANNYVQGQGIPLTPAEIDALTRRISSARKYVETLPLRAKELPELRPMEDVFSSHLSQLQSESTFKEHLQGMKEWRFAWVELSKVLVFQPHLNTRYVDSLIAQVPAEDAKKEVIEFCLPSTKRGLKTQVMQSFNPVTNTFTLVTDNLDFRILGNMQGEDPVSGRKVVGFAYGGGLPQMSVVEYRERFLLKNGYHRAYALFKRGHRFLPCLVVRTDNYVNTGAQQSGFFSVDTMLSDRPPRLEDFSSEASVPIPRRFLKVMITVHAESQAFPV
jgi:hypothetical protein